MIAKCLVTTSLVLVAASAGASVQAAELNATSAVDAVTVYPDGASVTRIIAVDLPAGDNTLVARDFPLGLDASSLRVEGEAATRIVIGAIDARPPRAAPPVNLPEIDKRIEALKDERVNLDGAIAAANARRKFAERFAEASPAGLGEKGGSGESREGRAGDSTCPVSGARQVRDATLVLATITKASQERLPEVERRPCLHPCSRRIR